MRARSVRAAVLTVVALGILLAVAAAVPASRAWIAGALPPSWRIAISAWRSGVQVDHGIRIPMPDGVVLAASLYRPKGAEGPLPTVYVRGPYSRMTHGAGLFPAFLFSREGYAVLVQDMRGTGDSQGELLPWRDAPGDGVATLDWIAAQPWSNGRIGTFGCSGLGEPQLSLGARNHPKHRAMAPLGAGGGVGSAAGRYSYFGVFEGGVPQLASAFGWFVDFGATHPKAPRARTFDRAAHLRTLPVTTMVQRVRPAPSGFDAFFTTPLADPRWDDRGYVREGDVSRVPAFVVNTWGDQTVGDALALAESWRRADAAVAASQRVLIGPGEHCTQEDGKATTMFGELRVTNATWPFREYYLAWFDQWLREKGDGLAKLAPYTFFMLGEDQWLSAQSWPPESATAQRWHLASGGRANTRDGDGTLSRAAPKSEASDEFRYDPAEPVPTRGGPICCTGLESDRPGPADQADVERRRDVLVYTSAPLEADLRIAGPLRARFTFSSDAPDTDLVARLVDVAPDGRALGIQEGALRLRYRDGFASPTTMKPGERYPATVDMRSIAHTLRKGHRLRLDVTSSSFPRLERNLNTGAPNNSAETAMRVAANRVWHGGAAESFLELWVLPEKRQLTMPGLGS